MKWLTALVIILAFWFWFAFSFFASNYRVHAKPSLTNVDYCLDRSPFTPSIFMMCSELDKYYDA